MVRHREMRGTMWAREVDTRRTTERHRKRRESSEAKKDKRRRRKVHGEWTTRPGEHKQKTRHPTPAESADHPPYSSQSKRASKRESQRESE